MSSSEPRFASLGALARWRVEETPDAIAFRSKIGGAFRPLSWAQWYADVERLAQALIELDVQPTDRVALLCSTRREWVQMDAAIHLIGAVSVPIHPALRPDSVLHILNDAGAAVLIVEDPLVLQPLERELPATQVRTVVVLERIRRLSDVEGLRTGDTPSRVDIHIEDVMKSGEHRTVFAWSELLEMGDERVVQRRGELESRLAAVRPDTLASLYYTSGTTGVPKGAMLTHDNFVSQARALAPRFDVDGTDEQLLFLPLSHIFGKVTVVLPFLLGYSTAFADDPLRAMEACLEVKPSFMATVPRLMEKVRASIALHAERTGPTRGKLFQWASEVGQRVSELREQRRVPRGVLAVEYRYARKIVFDFVRQRFGGRMRFIVSGGAPLDASCARFFDAAGIRVIEGYGLTETTGPVTTNLPDEQHFGSVGVAVEGIDISIRQEDGEVLVRGPAVMQGYWNQPEATAESMESGWLRTGDIGRIEDGRWLYITDRKKDLIVTAGGMNVAPERIERLLETHPAVSRAIVLGDRQRFVVALIEWNEDAGASATEESQQLLAAHIERINESLAPYEQIRRHAILPRPLTVESGELTPTGKLRRRAVAENRAALVDTLYR